MPIYFTVIRTSSSSGNVITPTYTLQPTLQPTPTPTPAPKPTPGPTPTPTPTPTPSPGQPVTVEEWGGWATTTVDSESTIWPTTPTSFDLTKIAKFGMTPDYKAKRIGTINVNKSGESIDVYGTMGTAIPWAIFTSIFGWKTREEMVATIIDSCNGKNNIPCCIIVQPINKFPDEISPTTSTNSKFDMVNNLCTNNCTDINTSNITATYNNGTNFPAYLLVPFQGCGGDCNTEFPDCFNRCSDNQKVVANFNYYTDCKTSSGDSIVPPAGCQQIKWMSDNNWNMTKSIEQQFYNSNNAIFAISTASNNGSNIISAAKTSNEKGRVNYCSGKNMHFDVQRWSDYRYINPYWCDLLANYNNMADTQNSINLPSNGDLINRGGDVSNTIVRYMLVPGNIFGNFDIAASGPGYIPPKYPLPTPACGGGGGGGGGGGPYRCGINGNDPNFCTNPTCANNTDCPKSGPNICYNVKCP